jgi:hypothetical protein
MIEHTYMHIILTEYQNIAETVTVSACRSETRWLPTQSILHRLQALKSVQKEVPG